jgi:glycogen(starch) synthase
MHVVMTTDATGGVWSYSLTLTSALRRRGIQVTLVSIGPPPDAMQAAAVPAGTRLIVTDYKLEWQEGLNGDVALSGAFIARLVDDLRPEIVHSNHYCYGSLATGAARVVVAHNDLLGRLTWCRHDGDVQRLEVPPELADYRAFVEEGLANAHVVVCPSRFMAATLAEHYQARPLTIVIPNGVEVPAEPPAERAPGRPLTAVIAGRLWDEAKNVDLAVAGVHLATAPVRLLAVGPTRSPDGLEHPVQADARVEPLGLLPQAAVDQAYRRADVYLAVSRYEPFGLAPLEAALTGCAVICNDLPSYHEVWEDVAIYFRRNDPADLARRLDELAADPDRLHEHQRQARQRALGFTSEVMADKYIELYRHLIDRTLPHLSSAGQGLGGSVATADGGP